MVRLDAPTEGGVAIDAPGRYSDVPHRYPLKKVT